MLPQCSEAALRTDVHAPAPGVQRRSNSALPITLTLENAIAAPAITGLSSPAKASGVSAKMLRRYESIGLVPVALRTQGGYRTYGPREVETLRFIRRARDLGLFMDRIKLLVGLWRNRGRPSREVKRIALAHVSELRIKLAELTAMCATLEELADACHGDQRPECPILRDLEAGDGRQPTVQPQA